MNKCNCKNCKYTRKNGGYMPHSSQPVDSEGVKRNRFGCLIVFGLAAVGWLAVYACFL